MRDLPHLRVTANPTERPYVSTGTVVTRRTFRRTTVRSRVAHASHLKSQAWQATLAIHHRCRDAPPQLCFGQTLAFTGDAGIVEALEPFSRHREGLELLNVVVTPAGVRVTVYFQKGRLRQLDAMIRRYRVGSVSATTGEAPNAALLEGIERISLAAAADLWTEDRLPFPPDGRAVWWEAWLHLADATQDAAHAQSSELLVTAGGRASGVWIAFPERIVVTAWATPEQLRGSFELLNCIAELRRASEPVVDYIDAPGRFQGELVAEAVGRVRPPGAGSPAVLLLDTGVDRGHPLLSAALAENDAQAVVTEWGGADHPQDKHGTGMAGIALYGDLTQLLTVDGEWRLRHRLVALGTPASRRTIRRLLRELEVGRRTARKKTTGHHPDRNAQFEKIGDLRQAYQAAGDPMISVDTKKKELVGNFHRAGRTYTQQTVETFDHDFPSAGQGKLIPHGVFDLANNHASIHLNTSHDTGELCCDSIALWWDEHGRAAYPDARRLLVLCDGGGSNSATQYLFKEDLQRLADRLDLELRVAHYPPYCSKHNPMEHRVFPHVTRACQGVVFHTVDVARQFIGRAATGAGLRVTVGILDKVYATGRKYAAGFRTSMAIVFDDHLPKWNYRAPPLTG